jgi:hypothetical protein
VGEEARLVGTGEHHRADGGVRLAPPHQLLERPDYRAVHEGMRRVRDRRQEHPLPLLHLDRAEHP